MVIIILWSNWLLSYVSIPVPLICFFATIYYSQFILVRLASFEFRKTSQQFLESFNY